MCFSSLDMPGRYWEYECFCGFKEKNEAKSYNVPENIAFNQCQDTEPSMLGDTFKPAIVNVISYTSCCGKSESVKDCQTAPEPLDPLLFVPLSQFVVGVFVTGMIIKRKSGEIPCPLAVEAFAAHLSYICKYDDKYSKYVQRDVKWFPWVDSCDLPAWNVFMTWLLKSQGINRLILVPCRSVTTWSPPALVMLHIFWYLGGQMIKVVYFCFSVSCH